MPKKRKSLYTAVSQDTFSRIMKVATKYNLSVGESIDSIVTDWCSSSTKCPVLEGLEDINDKNIVTKLREAENLVNELTEKLRVSKL